VLALRGGLLSHMDEEEEGLDEDLETQPASHQPAEEAATSKSAAPAPMGT
jgi:hypothetical protein